MVADISHSCPSPVQSLVPLAPQVWFRTGGSAEWYAEPTTPLQMQDLLLWANSHRLSVTFLGDGANVLISDEGIKGLVVKPAIKSIKIHTDHATDELLVTAGAGVLFGDLILFCLDHQIIGLEEFSGIPGTVGGSVFINIHYFSFLLSHFLVHATVINHDTGVVEQVDNSWFSFGYNSSRLHAKKYYLLDATFRLKQATATQTAYARGRRDEMIRYRHRCYPTQRTCGSFFRAFSEEEVTIVSNGRKMTFIGYYLDKLGVKGSLSYGGAQVSYQHANMIVTTESATSTDIIMLARELQKRMLTAFNLLPKPECQLLGFSHSPLLER